MMTPSKKNSIIPLLILSSISMGVSCGGSVIDLREDESYTNKPKLDGLDRGDNTTSEVSTAQTGHGGGSPATSASSSSTGLGGTGGAEADAVSSSTNGSNTASSSAAESSSSVSSSVASSSSSLTSSSSGCGNGVVHKWKEQPVIYVSGQSNATGGWYPPAGVYNTQNVTTWDHTDEKWKMAKAELGGDYSFGIGSWAGRLSSKLLDLSVVTSKTLKIKNHGWPGKSLSYFLPDSQEPSKRNAAQNDYNQARTSWTKSGSEPNIICWAQGEQDTLTPKDTYYKTLKSLVDAWHVDYHEVEVIIMVKTAEGACNGNTINVREVQEQIAQEYPDISLINLDDLTKNPKFHDGCHYTLEGYEILADRILETLSSL